MVKLIRMIDGGKNVMINAKKNKGIIVLLLVVILLLLGCESNKQVKLDAGKLNGTRYTNNYFGLQFDIPKSWKVQNLETQNKLYNEATKIAAGDDKNLKANLEASLSNSLYLFLMFKYLPGTPNKLNPSFLCNTENVKLFPGIQNGKDYLLNAKTLMKNTQIHYNFTKDIYSVKFDKIKFYVMETVLPYGSININQKYYTTILKGQALNFIITYYTKEDLAEVNKILMSIKFK